MTTVEPTTVTAAPTAANSGIINLSYYHLSTPEPDIYMRYSDVVDVIVISYRHVVGLHCINKY